MKRVRVKALVFTETISFSQDWKLSTVHGILDKNTLGVDGKKWTLKLLITVAVNVGPLSLVPLHGNEGNKC